MKLLSADRILLSPDDLVFRQSWVRPMLASLAAFGAVGALAVWGTRHQLPVLLAAVVSLPALFLGAMTAAMAWDTLVSNAWVFAVGRDRVLVRLRVSGPARGTPADEVVEVSRAEIHLVRSWAITTRAPQARIYTSDLYLDVELHPTVDTTAVAGRLLASLQRPLTTGLNWSTHPVTLLAGDTLRIQWRTTSVQLAPGIGRALSAFGPLVAAPVGQCIEFDNRTGDDPEALDRLRALVLEGNDMRARRIALRALRWSAERTRQFVRDTRGSATMFD